MFIHFNNMLINTNLIAKIPTEPVCSGSKRTTQISVPLYNVNRIIIHSQSWTITYNEQKGYRSGSLRTAKEAYSKAMERHQLEMALKPSSQRMYTMSYQPCGTEHNRVKEVYKQITSMATHILKPMNQSEC